MKSPRILLAAAAVALLSTAALAQAPSADQVSVPPQAAGKMHHGRMAALFNSPDAPGLRSSASPGHPTMPGLPTMARSRSTMVTTYRPGCAPRHRPDTSTPCWTSSVVDMSPWR